MKRFLCLLLSVLLLCGCNSGEAPQSESSATATAPAPVVKAVPTPLRWEDIDAIPVVTADMTEEELRQICLDFFRLQLTFQWTPANTFEYVISTYQEGREFKAGTIYAGLPYQGHSKSGNIYLAMEYYDPETGILDNTGIDGQAFSHILGNHCTSSPYWAWSRVVNSVPQYANANMTKAYGFLPVGDYDCTTIQWSEVNQTKAVCKQNGEQKMYEAYARLKPADGIFLYYSAGGNSHCRMVSSYPVVVRNADGSINSEESYLLYMDQGSGLKDYTAADGSVVKLQGKVDTKATFKELFEKSYITFTFGEFLGTDPVEPGALTLDLPGTVTTREMIFGEIRSNYPISYFVVTLQNSSGNVTYKKLTAAAGLNVYSIYLGKLVSSGEMDTIAATGDQTLTVQARIGTGELLTAYRGTLTANKG